MAREPVRKSRTSTRPRQFDLSQRDPYLASLSIGEYAACTGVSTEAIRFYEHEGLIPPAVRAGSGRYRRYRPMDIERLRFIRHARDLGFSLDEIRELLTLADESPARNCTAVNRIARAHLAQVEMKIAQLSALRAELDRIIGTCNEIVPVSECRILAALGGSEAGAR
jgi:DNA-binding transcriptional MerR regulator